MLPGSLSLRTGFIMLVGFWLLPLGYFLPSDFLTREVFRPFSLYFEVLLLVIIPPLEVMVLTNLLLILFVIGLELNY